MILRGAIQERSFGRDLRRVSAPARFAFRLLVVVPLALILASPGHADDVDPDAENAPLFPIPGLLRAVAKAKHRKPRPMDAGCSVATLPVMQQALPFGPGEHLTYDIAVLGVPTGEINIRVEPVVDKAGVQVMPLRATGQTGAFFSVFGGLNAQMVSYLDMETQRPLKMANRVHVNKPFSDEQMVREDAFFAGDQVYSHLKYRNGEKEREWDARRRSKSELLDVLSLVYYGRSRQITSGGSFCFEIFHRRALWRVRGKIGDVTVAEVPYGARPARRIDATVTRVFRKRRSKNRKGAGKNKKQTTKTIKAPVKVSAKNQSRDITLYVGEDEHRLPLLLVTENETIGEVRLRLTHFQAGRRLVGKRGVTTARKNLPLRQK